MCVVGANFTVSFYIMKDLLMVTEAAGLGPNCHGYQGTTVHTCFVRDSEEQEKEEWKEEEGEKEDKKIKIKLKNTVL